MCKQCFVRKKRVLILLLLTLLTNFSSYAYDVEVDGIYYNILSAEDRTAEVKGKGLSSRLDNLTIPETIIFEGIELKVVQLGNSCFRRAELSKLVLPKSITCIEYDAFDQSQIEKLVISDLAAWCNVLCKDSPFKSGGAKLYIGEEQIVDLVIPDGVASIREGAFNGCTSIHSVIVPSSLTAIEERAFMNCENLSSISLPNSVTTIGSYAFYECTNLKNVTLSDEISTIADHTFEGCTAIETVHFPENLIQINEKAFSRCTSLTEVVLPEKLTTMYYNAFDGCSELKTVISKSPTLIGRFSGCSNITKIESHVRKPDKNSGTFENNVKLFATLYVPVDAKEWYLETEGLKDFTNIIEGDWGIPRAKEVINVTEPGTLKDKINEITSEDVMTLTVKGALNANDISFLKSLMDLDMFKDLVELNIRDVTLVPGDDPYAIVSVQTSDVGFTRNVYYCYISDTPKETSSSTSTGLGGTSTSVYLYGKDLAFAFYGTKYKRIVMPSSVTEIGDYTFYGCSNLRSVEYSAPITYIGDCAFGSAKKLEEFNCEFSQLQKASLTAFGCVDALSPWFSNLPDENGIVYLGNVALALKSPLTDDATLVFREGTTAIAGYFYVSLFSDDLRPKYTSVKEYTVTLSLPSSVKYIGNKAFYSTNLNLITDLPSSLEGIGDYAFFKCPITKLTIPRSLEAIGAYSFAYTNIESLTIPSTVHTIGNFAFINNECLKSLVYDCPMENYGFDKGREMFSGCYSLRDLTIGNHVTVLPYDIFSGCTGLTEVTVPESVFEIVRRVDGLGNPFNYCTNLVKVNINCKNVMEGIVNNECEILVLGKTVEDIAERAFSNCGNLTTVNSYITNLGEGISDRTFSDEVYKKAVLHVPSNIKSLYLATNGWKNFKNIVEIPSLSSLDKEVNYSDENIIVNENTYLNGTVIDNVYYNISSDNGGFDDDEKCVVVNKAMSNEEIEEVFGKNLLSDEVIEKYTGLVIEVSAGKGKVVVEAQTTGGMTLMVKVGASEPMEMELAGKLKMKVPYNVNEPTYVYIYAGQTVASARTRSEEIPSLKIYGISLEVENDFNGDKKVNVADIVKDINDNGGGNIKAIMESIMQSK